MITLESQYAVQKAILNARGPIKRLAVSGSSLLVLWQRDTEIWTYVPQRGAQSV